MICQLKVFFHFSLFDHHIAFNNTWLTSWTWPERLLPDLFLWCNSLTIFISQFLERSQATFSIVDHLFSIDSKGTHAWRIDPVNRLNWLCLCKWCSFFQLLLMLLSLRIRWRFLTFIVLLVSLILILFEKIFGHLPFFGLCHCRFEWIRFRLLSTISL